MVTHQLQVRCRPEIVRRSETDVLPLSYTSKPITLLFFYRFATLIAVVKVRGRGAEPPAPD